MPHLIDVAPLRRTVRLPDPVAGHLGLELCNTRANWPAEPEHEYLDAPLVLAVWAIDLGLLDVDPVVLALPDGATSLDTGVVAAAKAFRTALYRCSLGAESAPPTPHDWDVVTSAISRAREVAVLRREVPDGPAAWQLDRRAVAQARGVDEIATLALHAAALAAERLLTAIRPQDVHACPGAGCGWLFLDPRHRRRWCTMAVCGNRAKARRHAERDRSGSRGR